MRAVLFKGSRDLIPLYALYALLFADHGLNTAQISSLLALWSLTAFVLEVPSGAWADTVSRRALLILSGLLMLAGFCTWTLAPTYLGFAIGFILWGVAGALESGTFEALVYDDLVALDESAAYSRIMGYTRAAQESTVVLAILAAAPLYGWGGYALVGWSSVAVSALHCLIALTLPRAPMAVSAAAVEDLDDDALADDVDGYPQCPPDGRRAVRTEQARAARAGLRRGDPVPGAAVPDGDTAAGPDSSAQPYVTVTVAAPDVARQGPFARYRAMLVTGVGEAIRVRRVRNGVLLGALLYGVTAYDEYFGLLAQEAGASTTVVPLLVGVTVFGSLIGSLLAGRTEAMRAWIMAAALTVSGVLFIAGSLAAGAASHRPDMLYLLTGLGFSAIGIAYGIVFNAEVVAGARLQDAIEGPARATVTSVSGLLSEVVALAVFGFVALVTTWLTMAITMALLGAAMLAIAAVTPAWLPRR
ncbi:MFS transporter [Nocardia sp. NPDC050710]|uniref:MFS transporter n=1 Tax=Nocardia sp. NPDC050710 TaxID=3157220 RepID=UPI0033D5A880